MIRVIFESKYIRAAFLVVCVLVAVFCVAASWRGEYIRTEKMRENIYDERGDYIIVEQNDVYTEKNKEGEALYTALGLYPEFTDKEGYIIDTTSPGRSGVVNFLTGEIVYTSDEYIYEMEGDRVVIQDEEGDYVYVDIYTGEKEDAGNEYY